MLTKIKDGWWVSLEDVVYFNISFDEEYSEENEGCYCLKTVPDKHFIFSNLVEARLFQDALEKYYR